MNKLIAIFKKLTPYDHFLVFLIILSVLKIIDVFIDSGTAEGLHFLQLGGALFVISMLLFTGFRYAFDKKKKYKHALISTFLILLMLSHADPDPVRGVLVVVLLYVSKFFIKYKKQNLFNPVVFAIGATTILALIIPGMTIPPLDWSGIDIRFNLFNAAVPLSLLPILLSLYFNVGRIRKHALALSFIVSALLLGFIIKAYEGDPFSYILAMTFIGTAIIVEPKTAPNDRNEQVIYGITMALVILLLSLVKTPNAAIMGLMLGNLVYFGYKQSKKRKPVKAAAAKSGGK